MFLDHEIQRSSTGKLITKNSWSTSGIKQIMLSLQEIVFLKKVK